MIGRIEYHWNNRISIASSKSMIFTSPENQLPIFIKSNVSVSLSGITNHAT